MQTQQEPAPEEQRAASVAQASVSAADLPALLQVLCARTGSQLTRWDPFVEVPKAALRLGASAPGGLDPPMRWTQQGWQLQAAAMACRDQNALVPDCKVACRHSSRERVLLALNFG